MKTKEITVRTPENIDAVRKSFENNPQQSTRSASIDLEISRTSVQRILRKDLGIYPYKIQVGQRLTEQDALKRLEFGNQICESIDRNLIDITKVIFSDEAHFYLDGYVNRQNYRIWGSEKPEIMVTAPLHPQKITVWAGMSSKGFLGPVFIQGETIDWQVYNRILTQSFEEAKLKRWTRGFWFQQDGATPHCKEENLRLIRSTFGDKVISRRYPEMFDAGINWPPYSPDLSPLDFFVWGHIKDLVYKDRPKSISELKKKIKDVFDSIPIEACENAISNFEKRARLLIHKEGMHIENILH